MSANHKEALKLLFPLELNGVFEPDNALEGNALDAAQIRAEDLLKEIFPYRSHELLTSWERVCGLTPGPDDPLQLRRDTVVRKLREIGGLSRTYFISLSAILGYTIIIEELQPFMAGINRCGDPLFVEAIRFVWRVKISGESLYYFRAGASAAGERLLSWGTVTAVEDLLKELKPAHTFIIFDYS